MIERALKIEGWMSPAELSWLAEKARSCQTIVEIGSWLGRSTAALADNCPGVVYAVDTWRGSKETDGDSGFAAGGPEWLWREFLVNMGRNVRPIRMTSVKAAKTMRRERFDMVFIDGAHDVESVTADIAAWNPLVSKTGFICGHDYYTTVKEAVDAFFIVSNPVGSIWVAKRLVEL